MRSFSSVEEMDEFMIDQWNAVVKTSDKVYHLGDVSMKKKSIATVGRCNGHKRLVRGNHDIFPTKEYLPYFEDIYGTRVFEDMVLSHIPLHPESVRMNWTNVHGHNHNNRGQALGVKYLNVCVELTDYRPLAIEEVRQRIREQKAENQRLIDENLRRLGVTKRWTAEELQSY